MKKIALYIAGLATGLFALFGITTALANPSYFAVGTATSSATSTVTYMTAGTATTTLIHDSFFEGNNSAVSPSQISLLTQLTSSTSAAVIDWTIEYAEGNTGTNCTTNQNGCDWYGQDTLPDTIGVTQTRFDHSSTTPNNRWGAGSATASTTRKLVKYDVPLRYIRATYVIPSGVSSSNAALYAKFVPVKERAEN